MIKIQDEEKVDLGRDLDDALIEEAITKWEAAEPLITSESDEVSE